MNCAWGGEGRNRIQREVTGVARGSPRRPLGKPTLCWAFQSGRTLSLPCRNCGPLGRQTGGNERGMGGAHATRWGWALPSHPVCSQSGPSGMGGGGGGGVEERRLIPSPNCSIPFDGETRAALRDPNSQCLPGPFPASL